MKKGAPTHHNINGLGGLKREESVKFTTPAVNKKTNNFRTK